MQRANRSAGRVVPIRLLAAVLVAAAVVAPLGATLRATATEPGTTVVCPSCETASLAEAVAVAALVMCLTFVIVDIGNPMAAWHLTPGIGYLNWPRSLLAWDVLVLNGYLALNLAISFAMEVDYTALLVDADLRDPDVRNMLELDPGPGLADYLTGKASIEELLIHPDIGNLVVMPGGAPVTRSSELMRSPMMADMIREMRARYRDRLIVFDVPPMLAGADALARGRLKPGDTTIKAGRLGEKPIAGDNILLGDILVFTADNIDQYDF